MLDTETGSLKVIDRPETSAYTKEVTFFSGGGGLASTAADYLRFNQMLLNGGILDGARIISPKTIQIMTTNHLAAEVHSGFGGRLGVASTYGFGLGFAVLLWPPLTALGSNGAYTWGGIAGTIFWNDPQEDTLPPYSWCKCRAILTHCGMSSRTWFTRRLLNEEISCQPQEAPIDKRLSTGWYSASR